MKKSEIIVDKPSKVERRVEQFQRNRDLEHLLISLNTLLIPAECAALTQMAGDNTEHPVVFIMGTHRSGTTLFLQWLANCGICAYPSNLLSRFFEAPIIGAFIQQILTDQKYNYRNEILDFQSPITFSSDNGKTKGALAPNEFWYFWRRFLPYTELDWLPDDELHRVVDTAAMVSELNALTRVFDKPFALKSMILNYNIPFLDRLFDKALFIQLYRDPVENVASVLEARKRQFGNEEVWYSFKIPEYPELKQLNALGQSAGQISYINRAVKAGMDTLDNSRKLLVNYEELCDNPRSIYTQLLKKLGFFESDHPYKGPERFEVLRKSDEETREKIARTLLQFPD